MFFPLCGFATTYEIAEPDLLTEIEENAKNIDYTKIQKETQLALNNYVPKNITYLPPAKKNYTYLVDMTYTLPFDVPEVDQNGNVIGILYPKGYKFNPLDYVPFTLPTLVVFSAEKKREIKWVREKYGNSTNTYFLTTCGDIKTIEKLMNELKIPIYYLTKNVKNRLKLRNTISVVCRDGQYMRVNVYYIQKPPKEINKKSKK